MVRLLAILFAVAILVSYGVAQGVAMLREAEPEPGAVVPPSPPKPRAMRVPARSIEGPSCPEVPLWQLFDGEIAGLGMVLPDAGETFIAGTIPGTLQVGPDPLQQLTVVDSGGSTRTQTFERAVQLDGDGNPAAFSLRVPLAGPARDRLAFVTSACLPNRATRGRWWSYVAPEPVAPDVQNQILEEVAGNIGAREWQTRRILLGPSDRLMPTRFGVLDIRLPGCRRLAIFNDQQSSDLLGSNYLSALFCIDGSGDMTRAPVPAQHGLMITQVGVLDLDADGRDEILVTHQEIDERGLHGSRDELLWHEVDTGVLHVEVLRTSK